MLKIFNEAEYHFQMNEFDEALQLLNQINNPICEQEGYVEQCIQSKLIRANISRNRREFDKATEILREGLDAALSKLSENHPLLVYIYAEFAHLETDQSSNESGKKWAEASVEIVEDFDLTGKPRARAYLALGLIEGGLGNNHKAIASYKEVFKTIEELEKTLEVKKLLTQAHNNIGVSYRKLGEIEKAMSHYQETLTLVRETFGSNHLEMGYASNSIGTVYFLNGDFGTAADYFQRSADIFRLNMGENSSPYAAALNNTGSAYYSMNDFENAAEIFEEAQRIKENTLGTDHPETAVGYTNLALIYEQNEDYDAALKNHELSISVRKNRHGSDHPNLVTPYLAFGNYYITVKRYNSARKQLHEAERIIELRLGKNHPDIWTVNNRIAETYQKEKNFEKAISYFQKALLLMTNGIAVTKESYNFDAITYPYQFLVPISGIGEISLENYKKSGKISALEDAYYFLMWSTDLIDELQTEYQSEASKLNLIDQNYAIYTSAIETCYYLFQETSDKTWLNEIFRLSEISRSRIALELLQKLQATKFAGVPEEVLNQERDINTRIADYYQNLHAEQEKGFEADEQIVSSYRDSLFTFRQNLAELTETLEQNYPDYYRLKYDQSFVDRNTVSDLLQDDETLVNYIVGNQEVYALVLDKKNISFHTLGEPDSLAAQIRVLRESVSSGNRGEYSAIAYELYNKLVKPILLAVRSQSLIIVPDQMLHYLPFEMLLTHHPGDAGYYRMPYLVRDFSISYVPSATVLHMLTEQKLDNPRNLFAVAPFNETAVEAGTQAGGSRYIANLSPLPLTSYETREIAEVFDQSRSFWDFFSPEKTEILLDRNATRSAIKNTSFEDYGFIHFATHAFVNEEDPALSGIAFWGDDESDGIIYVNDIYNMKLHADLVTLGACETGLGTVYKGEGMIGFTRAFIYAGAANLLVSMWRVNDQPTANLMIQFYKYARDGHSYSKSMQMAKMDLINQPEFAAPRNWAAFVLQGR